MCKCNCNHHSSEEQRLQSTYHELERKNPGGILSGKGMYDLMKAQQARREASEERKRQRQKYYGY